MYLVLGNHAPKEGYRVEVNAADHTAESIRALATERGVDASGTKEEIAARLSAVSHFRKLDDYRTTLVRFPEDVSLSEAFVSVTNPNGVWAYHSDENPDWVESDNKALADLLASHYGCTVGAPDDLEANYHTEFGPPGIGPDGPVEAAPRKGGKK